jgi:hypothetical protein
MSDSDATLRELKVISKILLLSNSQAVKKEIEKICGSDARKKMWVLTDGVRMPAAIATDAKVTTMAVSTFLNAGEAAGLIKYKRGEPPRRILDYVPPEWIELLQGSESTLEGQGAIGLGSSQGEKPSEGEHNA